MLQGAGFFGAAQDRLHSFQFRRLNEVVGGARAQRGNGTVNRGVARNHDHFGGAGILKLIHKLDPLAIGQAQVGEQHVRALPPKFDARLAQALRARHGKALHARDFLEPVQDVGIVIDD